MKKNSLLTLLFLIMTAPVWAAQTTTYPPIEFDDKDLSPLFPFNIQNGFPDNITNVHSWDKMEPAGQNGLVTVKENHFTNQKGTVRFLGTNFCFSASFPEKENAPAIARSLARFGINLVRLHHMDARNIWGKNLKNSTTVIDPEQLDRLDYLISEFKKNGVYVNINLHVSRMFSKKDGFPDADLLPRLDKGIDNLDRKMIELQKKYAKDLLTHVNPYTKNAYINEPAVAMIEINNENSIISSWRSGSLDDLPAYYADYFQKCWNDWLRKKYGSTKQLLAAWFDNKKLPELGKELLPDGKFLSKDLKKWPSRFWSLQTDKLSQSKWKFLPSKDQKFDGSRIFRIEIEKMGKVGWIPQVYRTNLNLEKDKIYTLSFWIRSDNLKEIRTSVGMNHEPYARLGLTSPVPVTTDWVRHEFVFRADKSDTNARVGLSGFNPGSIEFANVSLKEGCRIDLFQNNVLENGIVPLPKSSALSTLFRMSSHSMDDWALFMTQTENAYFQEMYNYVKNDLKAQPPITGTQFNYGARYSQARLDYADIHSYWNHPHFPNKRWDHNDWYLGGKALVDNMGSWSTITALASARAVDRPYTVSEYDHPYPNFYGAEGYPLLASLAAFQGWGGLMQFAWSHTSDPENKAIPGFFDMRSNPVKRLHLPACYAMFVRQDIKAGPGKFIYAPELSADGDVAEIAASFKHEAAPFLRDKTMSMAVYTGISLTDLKGRTNFAKSIRKVSDWKDLPQSFGSPEKLWVQNEFGELFWSFPKENSGYFKVDTPRTKLFTGFVNGRSFDYKAMTLSIGKTRLDWATVSLVQCISSGKGTETGSDNKLGKGTWLLAANGFVCNTDQITVSPKKGTVSTARVNGGKGGSAPALAEGVPMTLVLNGIDATAVTISALDESGQKTIPVKVSPCDKGTKIELGPQYKTLWYEITIR